MVKLKAVFLDFGNTIVNVEPFIKGASMGFVGFVKKELNLKCNNEELFARLKSTPFPPPEHPLLQEIKNREYYGRMLWGIEFAKSCGVKIDDSTENKMMEAYDNGAKYSDCLIGNAVNTLKILSNNYKLCIVSNGYSGFVHATLEYYNLKRFFSLVVVSQDVNIQKPDGKIYNLALADCGIEPQEALMVGDDYILDIWGAKIHGLLTCWINPENTLPSFAEDSSLSTLTNNFKHYPKPTGKEHDFMIKKLDELPEMIHKHNL